MRAKLFAALAPIVRSLATRAVKKYVPRVAGWLRAKARDLAAAAWRRAHDRAAALMAKSDEVLDAFEEGEDEPVV